MHCVMADTLCRRPVQHEAAEPAAGNARHVLALHHELVVQGSSLHAQCQTRCAGALFGMNLQSGLEETPGMFWPVVQGSCLAAVLTYTAIYAYWRRMPNYAHRQRVADIEVGCAACTWLLTRGCLAACKPA